MHMVYVLQVNECVCVSGACEKSHASNSLCDLKSERTEAFPFTSEREEAKASENVCVLWIYSIFAFSA